MAKKVAKKTTRRRDTSHAAKVPKKKTRERSKNAQGKAETARPRVLIADDDKPFRESLVAQFATEGFSVTCATSIRDSVRLARRQRYHVIVLDMYMPEKPGKGEAAPEAGLTVTRLLKRYGDLQKDVIVVVFTGYPSARDCFATIDAGAYYLPKYCSYADMGVVDMAGKLAAECKRLVQTRHNQSHSRMWLVAHYAELVEKFSGQAIAVLQGATKTGRLKTTQIGDRKVVSAPTVERLNARILRNPLLREAMPLVLEIWGDER